MSRLLPALLLILPAGATAGLLGQDPAPGAGGGPPPDPRATAPYTGAAVCRNCHRQPGKGAQYPHWKKTAHARAFQTLATPEARAIARERGLGDPQKEPACLRCHTTAWGEPRERVQRTFRVQWGVQCESCHGPGGFHKEQRMRDPRLRQADASGASTVTVDIPAGEIAFPRPETCTACHNEDSPTFRGFDFRRDLPKVAHVNPQRERPWIPESVPRREADAAPATDPSESGPDRRP